MYYFKTNYFANTFWGVRVKNNIILSKNILARIVLHGDIGIDTFASDTTTPYIHVDTITGRTHPPTIATTIDSGCRDRDENESVDNPRHAVVPAAITTGKWVMGSGPRGGAW